MRINQKGFGAVGVVAVVAVISIVGLVGWRMVSTQKDSDAMSTAKSQTASNNKKNTEHRATAIPTLEIKEWDVKIPLKSTDKGMYYVVDSDIEQSITNPTSITIFSKDIDALVGPTGESCKGEYAAYLLRLPVNDPKWQPAATVDDGNVSPLYSPRITVGDYKYAIATKKQYGPKCFEKMVDGDYLQDEATAGKFNQIVTDFTSDFSDLKAL